MSVRAYKFPSICLFFDCFIMIEFIVSICPLFKHIFQATHKISWCVRISKEKKFHHVHNNHNRLLTIHKKKTVAIYYDKNRRKIWKALHSIAHTHQYPIKLDIKILFMRQLHFETNEMSIWQILYKYMGVMTPFLPSLKHLKFIFNRFYTKEHLLVRSFK